jgi:type VI secretion system protein ImpC
VVAAVRTLAEQALMNAATMTDDAYSSIEAIIAEIDRKLSEQINLVLHKEEFQKVESAWRGLYHLVSNTETDENLKIRFMDISKDEMRRTMRRHKGVAWDQSPIFKRIYEEEYGQLGGEPYGCLVADYFFDHTPADVELLGAIAKISAASHAPFIAAAGPSLMGMESWQELANPRDLAKITSNQEHAPWAALRNTEDSRYIGLTMPRFLARLPYGVKTNPVDEFDFEEETEGADHRNYVWNNAAYAMAVNINRSFKQYGWCTMIRGVESGGTVENLPCHTFPTDDGGFDMKCPTEIAISDRREAELAKSGLIPLVHRKNTDHAAFIGAQSLQRPQEYMDADATANANLSARLPYLFASTRFRALPEVHRARQGRLVQGARRHAELAQRVDHALRRCRPDQLVAGDQGQAPAGRGRSGGGRHRRQPRLLRREVLPAPALPARRPDGFAAARGQAAVAEGNRVIAACVMYALRHLFCIPFFKRLPCHKISF